MRTVSMAVLLVCATAAFGGCKSSDPQAASTTPPVPAQSSSTPVAQASPSPVTLTSRVDPCKLLTSDELKTVQGEALQTTLPSERDNAQLVIAQCYYQLPTITNSVVVNVTLPKERGKSIKEYWRSAFVENYGKREEEEGEKEKGRPERISGVGEDAYWEGSGIAGALYVLKKDVIFRISLGGASDNKTKLEKSKQLARKAIARI